MGPVSELTTGIESMLPFLDGGIFAQTLAGTTIGEYALCLASILLITMLGKILVYFFEKYLHGLAKKTKNEFDDLVVEVFAKPLFLVSIIIGFYVGLHFLSLSEAYAGYADIVFFLMLAIVAAWVVMRLIDGFVLHFLVPLASKTESDLDDQLIPVLRNTLKVAMVAIILLTVLDYLGVNITTAIMGLGVGGLAFAFAAKETIADVFGGISIFTSRPFKVGDWINVAGVSGTVKEVGLRHTRIRALNKHIITIPNSKVASSIIENVSVAPRKMTEVIVGLTYDTKSKDVVKAMDTLSKIINERDDCEKEPLIVFSEFADSSVNLKLRYWIIKKSEFLQIRSEVLLEIKKRFDKEKLGFAFPTQTIHLEK